ncbi:unnamed protein product [Mytilus edulis]|uniref:Helix-turn-helix domain-containing protein n=1 Tax=Mytilus edulis TaxID=6550 RepID=A0A8S3TJL7_MYTED|nr:unnamed protein product [Mytilus edulis]
MGNQYAISNIKRTHANDILSDLGFWKLEQHLQKMTSYKIATLIAVVAMLSFNPQPTEAGFIGGCWATWSRCTRWSSWATGWLWKNCNDRCTDDEISQFFEHANRQHALLKFTHEKSQTKMQFLDVLVFKGLRFRETGILDLTTFRKKTENYQYLERSSCHPSSTFRGIIKGEMLRFKRCTNDPVDLQTQYALFSERLIKRGYQKNEIKTVMQEVTAKQRIDTLMVKSNYKHRFSVIAKNKHH